MRAESFHQRGVGSNTADANVASTARSAISEQVGPGIEQ
jgi:hypothetical protein